MARRWTASGEGEEGGKEEDNEVHKVPLQLFSQNIINSLNINNI